MPAKICPGLMDGRSQGGPASDEVKEQMGCPHGQSQRQERLREAAEAVSYTHLDVYKRQVRNLARLALEFDADFSHFLGEENGAPFRISRAKDRNRLLVGEEGSPLLISESMSGLVPDRTIAPCIAEFLPGAGDAAFHPQMFPGVELVYVICGSLTVSTGMRMELLGTADSAWIDGNVKRLYRCHGDKPAKALILPFASDL